MQLKRWSIALGGLAVVAAVPLLGGTPVLANLQQATESLVQAIRRPEVRLNLTADKKLVEIDTEGKQKISWQGMGEKGVVIPGDVLRYTVSSDNKGELAAKNLVITQPIPQRTVYQLDSATSNNGAKLTYSIDAGKSFVEKPTIKVTLPDGTVEERPAPAEMYTHIRWQFSKDLNPETAVKAMYQVQVK